MTIRQIGKMQFFTVLFFWLFLFTGDVLSEAQVIPWRSVQWEATQNKTLCTLQQQVGLQHRVGFRHASGEPIEFFLQQDAGFAGISNASLFIAPAPWRTDLTYTQDFPVYFDQQIAGAQLLVYAEAAESMLNALALGHYPTFNFIQAGKEVNVAASAINFAESLPLFTACRGQLLAFGSRQLQADYLLFTQSSHALTEQVKTRLQAIAAYFREVKSARISLISATALAGKADGKWFVKRAKQVRVQLIKLGVEDNRIRIKSGLYSGAGKDELVVQIFGPDALRFFYYRKGNTALNHQEKQRLDLLAQYAKTYLGEGRIRIESHTDSKGSRSGNLKVSQVRGDTVRDYLISRGLDSSRIVVKAYGESRPVKSNRFPPGRAQNRRVVVSFAR
jgi:OmpA family protein/flagellar T-ring MotY-like protein